MEFQDGTRVVMTEESLVYLRRQGRRLTGVPPRSVEIVEGQAEVSSRRLPGLESEIEILVGGARALSRPDEAGVAQTRARRAADDSAKVMVYEGGGEVEAGGQKVAVARGMGTSVPRGRPPDPPEKLLPAATGLDPAPGARLLFSNVELTWQPVEGAASYTAELCRDADCALLVRRRPGLNEPAWQPPALARGDYFWRVTAVSRSGLDGYPTAGAALAVLGGADTTGPAGTLVVSGPQLRRGSRLVVDENVQLEPRLSDGESGVAGWRPWIDGREASAERWRGPWSDGAYRASVVAVDRAGNESTLPQIEFEVDATPPRLEVSAWIPSGGLESIRPSRCGWLARPARRWPTLTECDWLARAQRRWLARGWSWVEASVDGVFWRPVVEQHAPLVAEIRRAGLDLPVPTAAVTVHGDDPQLLLRSAAGAGLRLPEGGGAAPLLRVRAIDGGGGVARLKLRLRSAESGATEVVAVATDAFGHRRELAWSAQP